MLLLPLLLMLPADRWVTDADLQRLAAQHSIQEVDLAETKVTNAGLQYLKNLTGVRGLNLYYAEYINEDGLAFLRNWHSLERLNLRGARVTSKIFEHLGGLRELRDLDLGFSEITDEGFEQLVELPKLERLVIGGNRLSGECLGFLRQIASLRDLDLGGTQRVDSGLWGVSLTDQNLGRIGELKQLRRLSLAGATISDRGVDKPGSPEAERSDLRDLSALRGLVNLEFLDLSRQLITAESLKTIAVLPKLRTLRLGLCRKLDDRAVPLLLAMQGLREVQITGSAMTADALAQLEAELAKRNPR